LEQDSAKSNRRGVSRHKERVAPSRLRQNRGGCNSLLDGEEGLFALQSPDARIAKVNALDQAQSVEGEGDGRQSRDESPDKVDHAEETLELSSRGGSRHIAYLRDTRPRDPYTGLRDHVPQVRDRRSIEATLGRLYSQGVSVEPPEYFGQVYRMLSHGRGEYNDIINVNPDIGQVTEDVRHHSLKLSR
jgi:hypothetical protein